MGARGCEVGAGSEVRVRRRARRLVPARGLLRSGCGAVGGGVGSEGSWEGVPAFWLPLGARRGLWPSPLKARIFPLHREGN